MTLTKYSGQYEELFRNAVWYSDGSLTSSGTLANMFDTVNDGTITGATKTGTDRFGIANKTLYYSGTSHVAFNPILLNFPIKTISMWVYLASRSGTSYRTFLTEFLYGEIYRNCMDASESNNPNKFTYTVGNTSSQYWGIVSTTTISTTPTWYFITWVINDTSKYIKLYINGNQEGMTTSYTGTLRTVADSGTSIGADRYTGQVRFPFTDGNIGEVIIHSRDIGSVESKMLYNLTSKKYLYPTLPGIRGVQ